MASSSLLAENENLARNLSVVSAAGLSALDALDRHQAPAENWKTEQTTILQQAAKPDYTQVLLMVVPPIQKLVEYVSLRGGCSASK
jgi:hypothetical protein